LPRAPPRSTLALHDALPIFALVQMSRARRGLLERLSRRDGLRIAVLGFIGYYLSSFLDFLGLQYISAGLERLILFLAPTFVLLFSAWFLRKPVSPRQWLAMALAYGGVALVFWADLSITGDDVVRSEERRVGKEWSTRWWRVGGETETCGSTMSNMRSDA